MRGRGTARSAVEGQRRRCADRGLGVIWRPDGIVPADDRARARTPRTELASLRAQFAALEGNVSGLDAKVSGLDIKVSGLDAKVAPMGPGRRPAADRPLARRAATGHPRPNAPPSTTSSSGVSRQARSRPCTSTSTGFRPKTQSCKSTWRRSCACSRSCKGNGRERLIQGRPAPSSATSCARKPQAPGRPRRWPIQARALPFYGGQATRPYTTGRALTVTVVRVKYASMVARSPIRLRPRR
jgi:hypothetical protein